MKKGEDKIMNKKVLVITYHVKNCIRIGGFHYFIKFLIENNYDVDWVTVPVSISWILKRSDRENFRNFFDLVKGIEYVENNSLIRHFTVPLWIPAKLAKKLKFKIGDQFWPKWDKLKKRLSLNYDVILVEGVGCQYAKNLKMDYPKARILYRPSDILSTFSSVSNPEKLEKKMIYIADKTLCVDEACVKYYKSIADKEAQIEILRNPITRSEDINIVKNFLPCISNKFSAVYVGVSFVDIQYVEYAAKNNPDTIFYLIGPFNKVSHDNIIYTGILSESKYEKYLKNANVGIVPLNSKLIDNSKGILPGYTRKIINYMKYLLPIVATCSSNYLNIPGFFCVDTKEEFSSKITETLKYSIKDREKLREGYMYAMNVFSETEAKKNFMEYVRG